MFKTIKSTITASSYKKSILTAYEDNQQTGWQALQPALEAQQEDLKIAKMLVSLVYDEKLPIEHGLQVLSDVLESHNQINDALIATGRALECVRDIDQLNLAPSDHPLFQNTLSSLQQALKHCDAKEEKDLTDALSTAARMMARQHDDLALESYRRLTELEPKFSGHFYGLGLYCKTRGRFAEGIQANQTALSLASDEPESYLWNLGICATGAGEGEIALEIWKKIGCKIEMGRFDLPEGRFPSCKVRLAQYPLTERTAKNDYPGQEETIWIERLSPCHGIIRSVLYYDLGVDYGDVVLTDGAPITYHTYGEEQIAIFPHLATLIKRQYAFFDFVGVQDEKGQIGEVSDALQRDAVVYVHTDNFRILCASCWRDPDHDHQKHDEENKNIVTGRIAAPPDYKPHELLAHIDAAFADLENCQIFSPSLCRAAGHEQRAEVEERRFNLLYSGD